jgi:hypothetical protein
MRLQHADTEGVELTSNEFRNYSANRIAMVERVRQRQLERPRMYR